MRMMTKKLAAIEAGGTKFMCTIGDSSGEIFLQVRIPTTTPEETIKKCVEFFHNSHEEIEAFGIASFGPIDLDKKSPTWGYITTTPKPGWQNADLVGGFKSEFDVPFGFDTDVNGAALGEYKWGAAQGLDSIIYLTIGTGVGGGLLSNGTLAHGMLHPEMGHIILPLHEADIEQEYFGSCPFHKGCLEGLVCGPAIEKRYGQPSHELDEDHKAWDLISEYVAQALHNFVCIASPQKIIVGGGVTERSAVLPLVRTKLTKSLNGYVKTNTIENMEEYVVVPGLGNQSGSKGALALAERALLEA